MSVPSVVTQYARMDTMKERGFHEGSRELVLILFLIFFSIILRLYRFYYFFIRLFGFVEAVLNIPDGEAFILRPGSGALG